MAQLFNNYDPLGSEQLPFIHEHSENYKAFLKDAADLEAKTIASEHVDVVVA